jgi:peroxiredoxin
MKMKLISAFFCCFAMFTAVKAQVMIAGNDTSYIGETIKFYKYADRITETEVLVGQDEVDEKGNFSISFTVDETTFVFAYLGIYKVHLYVEPDKHYNVVLPPKTDKTAQEKLNPYFQYVIVHLGTRDYIEDDLNTLIRMFNDAYLPYYNKHLIDVANKKDFPELDKDIEKMDKPFQNYDNEYFSTYRKFRFALLRNLTTQQKSREVTAKYLEGEPIQYNNLAYMEMLDFVFEGYLMHYARTPKGSKIFEDINDNKSFKDLKNTLLKDDVFDSDELLEMVVVKNIYDECYDDNFSREALMVVLDSIISQTAYPKIKEIGNNVKAETTRLLKGYAPPPFKLKDQNGNLVSLDDFKGKYVYLNFCTCYSYTCLNEFAVLQNIYDKHKDYLEVVTIIADEDVDVLSKFLSKNSYNWTFLHFDNQPEIMKEYDIRAYPTYYLIGPDGKLLMSPAPAPREDFESYLFKIMKERGDL